MKKLSFLLYFLSSIAGYAQDGNDKIFLKNAVIINAGSSFHGTGDLRGFEVNIEYLDYFRDKLFWSVNFSSTLHDGDFPIDYTDQRGELFDLSVRYTTAGIQIGSKIGYDFLRTNKCELGTKIGGFIRYQSSSYYDELIVYYPAAGTGLDTPVNVFINRSPQRTIAIGAELKLFFNYNVTQKIFLGTVIGIQTDSNGDFLRNLSFTGGIRF